MKKGSHASDELKQKLSESHKGRKHSHCGHKISEETKQKISDSNRGRIVSEETREKLSISKKSRPKQTEEERKQREAKYRQEHKEEIKLRNAKYRKEHPRDRKEYHAKYVQEHSEEIKAYMLQYNKEYRAKNFEILKLKSKIRRDARAPEINKKNRMTKARLKQAFINSHGGHCVICGYSKSSEALDFHHVNRSDKNGKIRTIEEADKCVLLCANCHREHHHGGILY